MISKYFHHPSKVVFSISCFFPEAYKLSPVYCFLLMSLVLFKKSLPNQGHADLYLFASESFVVLVLTFLFVICFELIFVCLVYIEVRVQYYFPCRYPVIQNLLLKNYSFPLVSAFPVENQLAINVRVLFLDSVDVFHPLCLFLSHSHILDCCVICSKF